MKLYFLLQSVGNDYYMVGLILNAELAHLCNEKGPIFGTPEAVKFKELWGEKSEVLHIDGGVYECVKWPDKGNLILKIVNFIMTEYIISFIH